MLVVERVRLAGEASGTGEAAGRLGGREALGVFSAGTGFLGAAALSWERTKKKKKSVG